MDRIPKPGENVGDAELPKLSKRKNKGMDKVLIGLFVIFVIIIAYTVLTMDEDLGIHIPDIPIISGNGTVNINEQEILDQAVLEKNVSICLQLSEKQQECYELLSLESKNACVKVEDYDKLKECISYFAEEEETPSLCNALNEEDIEECKLLAEPCYGLKDNEKKYCLAVTQMNYTYCWSKDCVYEYAMETGDESPCENFFNATAEKVACSSLVEEWNRCNKNLALISEKDHCNYIYATKTDNMDYCLGLAEDGVYRYMCFVYFTLEENNYEYCDYLMFNDKWDCLTNYSLETGDVAGCDSIDSQWASSHYEYCYFHLAVDNYKPLYCEKLVGPTSRDSCYAQSIMDDSKPLPYENCEGMIESNWQDKCYKYSAKKNQDMTICNYIKNENTNQMCLDQFEE